jgi:sulfate adenylyltransferase
MDRSLPPPFGGKLVERFISNDERDTFLRELSSYKSYLISNADLSIFYRIADGALSPLEGPMESSEFYRVLEQRTIVRNGIILPWTIPLAFPIAKMDAERLEIGEVVSVKNQTGDYVGLIEISDIYFFDKNQYNKSVYGTDRKDHPGPRIVNDDTRNYLLGGKIRSLPVPRHTIYGQYLLSPYETRQLFQKRKWDRIIAFQTRNPLHRAHEYAIVYAMETLTRQGNFTGAVINAIVGATKYDDVPAEVRMKSYEILLNKRILGAGDIDSLFWKSTGYDLVDQVLLIGLDMKMFYAGPKEAIMHAIYRQNYGFTDIIIGRKHADAPFDDGKPVWGDFDAQQIFNVVNDHLAIRPFKVGHAAYFDKINRVGLIDQYISKGYSPLSISGQKLREKLRNSLKIDERLIRRPVAQILSDFYRTQIVNRENVSWSESSISKHERAKRNGHRGMIIWLTGLSGSGKSTIASRLQYDLFKLGCQVFILDGDNIRMGLNKDLGFSPEDREENIRRIGEVAKLFANAGMIVITAFISPYKKDRNRVRLLMAEGEFIEIYVKASLNVCRIRDPKGLYKKAVNGEIKDFTGVSAPYEEPDHPELIIETDRLSLEQEIKLILSYLRGHHKINESIASRNKMDTPRIGIRSGE